MLVMAEMTCQAEIELSLLAGQLRRAIEQVDRANGPDTRKRWVAERERLRHRLGERAAVLLPVLLEELRDLREQRK
jgi:hypothetical protein